jgi:hypothetical protein
LPSSEKNTIEWGVQFGWNLLKWKWEKLEMRQIRKL